MVAWHPDQLRKSRRERLERQFEMSCGFSDVAGQDQPIAWMTGNAGKRAPVDFIAEMKIADRIQFHADCFIGGGPSTFDSPAGVVQCKRMEGSTPRGAAAAIAILCWSVGAY